jgi:hypothetical protein
MKTQKGFTLMRAMLLSLLIPGITPLDSGSLWLARPLTFETFIQYKLPI